MADIKHTIKLNLIDTGVVNTGIRVKQGDSGISFVFDVNYAGTKVYEASNVPTIVFRRSDGTSIVAECTASNNNYVYSCQGNELEYAGQLLVDLKFAWGGRESTCTARLDVVPDTITKDQRPADVYVNSVTVEEINEAVERVADAEGYADAAEESATAASGYKDDALASKNAAKTSEDNAKASELHTVEVAESIPADYSTLSSDVTDLKGDINTKYNVVTSRMDSFTHLAEGSTTGDAELIDGRIGADGHTYSNIGSAIREQVSSLDVGLCIDAQGNVIDIWESEV